MADAAQFDGEKWVVDWEQVRKNKLASGIGRPNGWPENVVPISTDGLSLIGVDPATNQFYWDGQPLLTEKRWGTVERRIAVFGLLIAGIGVAATVAQAIAAFTR